MSIAGTLFLGVLSLLLPLSAVWADHDHGDDGYCVPSFGYLGRRSFCRQRGVGVIILRVSVICLRCLCREALVPVDAGMLKKLFKDQVRFCVCCCCSFFLFEIFVIEVWGLYWSLIRRRSPGVFLLLSLLLLCCC